MLLNLSHMLEKNRSSDIPIHKRNYPIYLLLMTKDAVYSLAFSEIIKSTLHSSDRVLSYL